MRSPEEGAGDGHPLLLAATQLQAALAHNCVPACNNTSATGSANRQQSCSVPEMPRAAALKLLGREVTCPCIGTSTALSIRTPTRTHSPLAQLWCKAQKASATWQAGGEGPPPAGMRAMAASSLDARAAALMSARLAPGRP